MGTLFIVSTPIGNLEDLSRRGERVLREADRVLAEDTRRTRVLLDHVESRAPMVSLHDHNEAARVARVLEWLDAGETLALVSDAGTPLVSDPGERLIPAVVAAGHAVHPIPGASAVLAALVGSGLPAAPFVFLGFPPRKGREREDLLQRVVSAEETVVLFESPERLVNLLEALESLGGAERRVSVARELTKVHETFVRGPIAEVLPYFRETPPRGEVTVVVAPAETVQGGGAVDRAAIEALGRALLAEGESPSRAARAVARRLGVGRNMAYGVIQEMMEGGEP